MAFQVYGYRHIAETTYSGPKKRPNIIRRFDGVWAPREAHAFAKSLIEAIPAKALYASVEEVD